MRFRKARRPELGEKESSVTDLYPEIDPHEYGMLEVGGGDLIYWESCGNPRGKPAIVLHGGPGSGCVPWHRRLFDPNAYRLVLFDQRGVWAEQAACERPRYPADKQQTHPIC